MQRAPSRLVGRAAVLRQVEERLTARRSVLLVGPAGSGKTAVIREVSREGLVIVDPFAAITTPRAAALRRALDRGATILGAARSLARHDMGHVGRVSWRLEHVYLRPLPPRDILRIIRDTLAAEGAAALRPDPSWMSEAVTAAAGLPGGAAALASVVATRWHTRGRIVRPQFALVIAWQDGIERTVRHFNDTGVEPGESSS